MKFRTQFSRPTEVVPDPYFDEPVPGFVPGQSVNPSVLLAKLRQGAQVPFYVPDESGVLENEYDDFFDLSDRFEDGRLVEEDPGLQESKSKSKSKPDHDSGESGVSGASEVSPEATPTS